MPQAQEGLPPRNLGDGSGIQKTPVQKEGRKSTAGSWSLEFGVPGPRALHAGHRASGRRFGPSNAGPSLLGLGSQHLLLLPPLTRLLRVVAVPVSVGCGGFVWWRYTSGEVGSLDFPWGLAESYESVAGAWRAPARAVSLAQPGWTCVWTCPPSLPAAGLAASPHFCHITPCITFASRVPGSRTAGQTPG